MDLRKIEPEQLAKYIVHIIDTTAMNFDSNDLIKHNNQNGARFEVFLIFFEIAREVVKTKLPVASNKVEGEMFHQLFDICLKTGLMSKLKPNAVEFIHNRLRMYKTDLYNQMNSENWIMVQTIHAIYYEPLKAEIADENYLNDEAVITHNSFPSFMFSSLLISYIDNFMPPLLALIDLTLKGDQS